MFWGLILEPNRRYSQVVKKPFRITMAALDVNSSGDDPTQVIVTFENRNFLLCTLQKGEILNERLDLCFEEGDQVSFAANGNSHVHLTGYLESSEEYLEVGKEEEEDESEEEDEETTKDGKKRSNSNKNMPPTKKSKTLELLESVNSDSEDDSDFSLSNPLPTESTDEEDSASDEEEAGEEEDDEDEELEGEEEEDDDDDDDIEEEEDEDDEMVEEIKPEIKSPKKQPQKKKQQNDIKKTNNISETTKGDKNKKADKEKGSPQKNGTSQKKTIEGGVGIEELKTGNGAIAKPGKFVQVYYEGRLKSNNKLFDSATKGTGFEFRLGRQEVIKGWDIGVAGMKVGGKRRITCPPAMAYGAKGSPPAIPPNSTLVFDVELKKVK